MQEELSVSGNSLQSSGKLFSLLDIFQLSYLNIPPKMDLIVAPFNFVIYNFTINPETFEQVYIFHINKRFIA